MVDPLTAIAIGGLVLDIFGRAKSGSDQQDAFDAQAAAARKEAEHRKTISIYNARQLSIQASRTRRTGVEEENKIREATSQRISSIRASFGAGNIIADTGTPASLQITAAQFGEIDALRVRRNHMEAAGELDQRAYITTLEGDAELAAGANRSDALIRSGDAAFTSGLINAAGAGFDAVSDIWKTSDA